MPSDGDGRTGEEAGREGEKKWRSGLLPNPPVAAGAIMPRNARLLFGKTFSDVVKRTGLRRRFPKQTKEFEPRLKGTHSSLQRPLLLPTAAKRRFRRLVTRRRTVLNASEGAANIMRRQTKVGVGVKHRQPITVSCG